MVVAVVAVADVAVVFVVFLFLTWFLVPLVSTSGFRAVLCLYSVVIVVGFAVVCLFFLVLGLVLAVICLLWFSSSSSFGHCLSQCVLLLAALFLNKKEQRWRQNNGDIKTQKHIYDNKMMIKINKKTVMMMTTTMMKKRMNNVTSTACKRRIMEEIDSSKGALKVTHTHTQNNTK